MRRSPLDRLPHRVRLVVDWAGTILFAVAIVFALKQWIVNPYRIPSSSMEPTLHCARPGAECEASISDRVLACRFCYDFRAPRRGDIVVFDTPPAAKRDCGEGGTYVKRLIGLPGDTWAERNGVVYIDGKPLHEPYIPDTSRDAYDYSPRKIPPGRYFFMGDNRKFSCDSRRWGTVPRRDIIGLVFATYWPPSRISVR
ncbi:MAG TPA: signal peptidase I [Gaiellaceae bacterium]|nr:signal peptidase I [Gaiellaceae bacterium]